MINVKDLLHLRHNTEEVCVHNNRYDLRIEGRVPEVLSLLNEYPYDLYVTRESGSTITVDRLPSWANDIEDKMITRGLNDFYRGRIVARKGRLHLLLDTDVMVRLDDIEYKKGTRYVIQLRWSVEDKEEF